MAGDWIKVRMDLHRDPAVFELSRLLERSSNEVVGALVLFWSWCSEQTTDGNVSVTQLKPLDTLVSIEGWCDALKQVGWLEHDGRTLTIPHFDRHLSKPAKRRGLTYLRVKAWRERERNAPNVPNASPETETEMKKMRAREEGRKKNQNPPPRAPHESPDQARERADLWALLDRHHGTKLTDNAGLKWEPGPNGCYGPRGYMLVADIPLAVLRELGQEARKLEAKERAHA